LKHPFSLVMHDVKRVSSTTLMLAMLTILGAVNLTSVIAVTWSGHEVRLTTYRDFDGMSSIIQTSDGKLWVFWSRSVNGHFNIMCRVSADEGVTWSQETQLTSDSGDNTGVSTLQMSNGVLLIAWSSSRTGNNEIFCRTSADRGSSWSLDTQITLSSSRNLKPALCQAANGSIWVVWSSDRSGGYDLYYKTSSDCGASWSSSVRLTTDLSLDKSPAFLQARDGRLWVFWSSDRTGDYDIFYKIYNGTAWSNTAKLHTSPSIDLNPFILQTTDSRIYVFWCARQPTQTATDDIYYTCSSDGGVSWSEGVEFASSNYDDLWPSAIQTYDTKIWVTWTSDKADQPDGNWDIYMKTSLVGDVNGDGVTNVLDLARLGLSFGYFSFEQEYDVDSDLNTDGVVDMRDICLIVKYYGET
jgi:hypothetical protein